MTIHISNRLAWHMDGWNGRVCGSPADNTYCVGQHSFPGDMIAEGRKLEWEETNKGRPCKELGQVPPCMYSINAFSPESLEASAAPPDWFRDQTEVKRWLLHPYTVATWPYEEMYSDEVKNPDGVTPKYDPVKRRSAANAYFEAIEPNQSLIFYYANYSNPFSEEEQKRYVVVGVSRVKAVGEELTWSRQSPEMAKRYGPNVWVRCITSNYPDEGLRIPYHAYINQLDILERILFVPDNPRLFKYATRQFSDDEALALVERLQEIVGQLEEIGDNHEDWVQRQKWLISVQAELWKSRGLYPGLPKVLDYLDFKLAIPFFRKQVIAGREHEAREAIFSFLEGRSESITGLALRTEEKEATVRQWQIREDDERALLRDVLPRLDLGLDQLRRVLSERRSENGIHSSLLEVVKNPYILGEEFVGDGPDDVISFNKIDHGVFPSPELGGQPLAKNDDWRRLRALCVERLRNENMDSFMSATQAIHDINHRLSFLPEWKRHQFTERYLEVDKVHMSDALVMREHEGRTYLYLRSTFDDEREIEVRIRSMAARPSIVFRSPVTSEHWRNFLYDPGSGLATNRPKEYGDAIQGQADTCAAVFVRPVCVVSGEAGTGKTTVIKAIIKAIEKAHGGGASFQLLAPTGKAADRIREATGRSASTIHSFLAQHGWLNNNLTFKRSGGRKEDGFSTYIVDEASMLDLHLAAALFRAINWNSVQRLIFVGDQNQLPPIGRGKVFADLIDWLQENSPESVGVLKTNIRQMDNRLNDSGTGILDIASLYVRTSQTASGSAEPLSNAEIMLRKVQEGGDVDKDLRIIFWDGPNDLAKKLIATIVRDMELDTGKTIEEKRPFQLWKDAFTGGGNVRRPEYQQVISPYRGEQSGTEHLNSVLQKNANGHLLQRIGNLGGVTLFDKVIQTVNHTKSNPVFAYSTTARRSEAIEVYNGEIGFADPDLKDWKKTNGQIPWLQQVKLGSALKRFQIVFGRKPEYRVYVNSESFVEENIELAYVISVHKAQGSEFERVYFVLPKNRRVLLSRELFYTGITRARRHCTILIEEDISPLLSMRRLENSRLLGISSSLFEFRPMPDELRARRDWYEEGKIHRTLADIMVRSKSEVIIANLLFDRDIPFRYEVPLFAPDGTFYLPDFTITRFGEDVYWEHLGLLDQTRYRDHWETKKAWYDKFFPGRLIVTEESGNLSQDAAAVINEFFS